MKFKIIISAIAVVAFLVIGYVLSGGSQILDRASGEKPVSGAVNKPVKPKLPEFAQKTGRVTEAYIFAAQNQDKIMYLACYCGCAGMQHSEKLLSHKSLKEDYVLVAMNLDVDRDVAGKYGVNYPPYVLFLDGNDKVIDRVAGAVDANYFLPIVTQVRDQVRSK